MATKDETQNIKEGAVVKFRNASDDIIYGVIAEICEMGVWIIVGINLDGDVVDMYEIGDFKERSLAFLSPGAVVEKLNIVRKAVA